MEKKQFYVGISCPWGMNYCGFDVEENKDFLSPDLMAKLKGVETPLLKIEAENKEEAVEEYKKQVPGINKIKKLEKLWEPA